MSCLAGDGDRLAIVLSKQIEVVAHRFSAGSLISFHCSDPCSAKASRNGDNRPSKCG